MDKLFVANTIREQIGQNSLMCFGARQFMGWAESDSDRGRLTFVVSNNPKIQRRCFVTVVLDFDDTYTVSVWYRNRSNEAQILSESKGIYCDQLSDLLFSVLG